MFVWKIKTMIQTKQRKKSFLTWKLIKINILSNAYKKIEVLIFAHGITRSDDEA